MYKLTNKDKAMLRWIESPVGTKAVTNVLNSVNDVVVNAAEPRNPIQQIEKERLAYWTKEAKRLVESQKQVR